MKKTLFGLLLCALSVLPLGSALTAATTENSVKIEKARWYGSGYYGGWGWGSGYGYGGWGYGYPYSYGYGYGCGGGCCGGGCGGGLFGFGWF